mgnify:CR=1 FL=1
MPKNTRKSGTRKNRRTSQPNVFVQSQAPEDSVDDGEELTPESAVSTQSATRVKARVERGTRIASVRSEIYTRSLSAELRKMGALAGAVVVALAVLTFAL